MGHKERVLQKARKGHWMATCLVGPPRCPCGCWCGGPGVSSPCRFDQVRQTPQCWCFQPLVTMGTWFLLSLPGLGRWPWLRKLWISPGRGGRVPPGGESPAFRTSSLAGPCNWGHPVPSCVICQQAAWRAFRHWRQSWSWSPVLLVPGLLFPNSTPITVGQPPPTALRASATVSWFPLGHLTVHLLRRQVQTAW